MSQSGRNEVPLLLQRALSALQSGRQQDGERALRQVLAINPQEPDALQLLGLVAKTAGRTADAIDLFRRSLRARPGQPHVLNNLATTLAASGETASAEEQYRRALDLKPDYADASLNLGLLLQGERRLEEAETCLRAGLSHAPRHVGMLQLLGTVLMDLGRPSEAVPVLQYAAEIDPRNAAVQHNLGRARVEAGDHSGAETAYRAALAIQPGLPASVAGLSHLLRVLGRNDEAIDMLTRAVERDPGNLDAHQNLGAVLWELDRADDALAAYKRSISKLPNRPLLRVGYAGELIRRGLTDEARQEVSQALSIAPDLPQAVDAMARIAAKDGNLEEAARLGRQALGMLPGMPTLSVNLSDTLLRLGRPGEVIDLLGPVHLAHPADQAVLSRYILALRQADDRAYRRFVDLDAMTTVIKVEPPPGHDIDSFQRLLADYLRGVHTAKVQPKDQTLEKGTQTFGNLFTMDRSQPVQMLRTQIAKAVSNFIASMPNDGAHPFFARRRGDLAFAGSWSVRLHCQGFHTNHMHPQGWISSAYYIALPDETADMDGKQGWFKLGESNLGLGGPDVPERFIQPKPGHLVLFPSYFWHGTVPFERGAERLTVAFDAIPA